LDRRKDPGVTEKKDKGEYHLPYCLRKLKCEGMGGPSALAKENATPGSGVGGQRTNKTIDKKKAVRELIKSLVAMSSESASRGRTI